MKIRKLLPWLTVLLVILFSQGVQAQTFHRTLTCTISDCVILCLNRAVYGTVDYDVSYHLDNKTGKIDFMSWNAHGAELFDTETGEKYNYMDRGSDRLGVIWDFFNNPNIWNTGYPIHYDVDDGWLGPVMPSELPNEGTFVNTYKLIGKEGTKVSLTLVMQLHLNAKGEITVEVVREKADCL